MERADQIKRFYMKHLPGASVEGNLLKAPCPFCESAKKETKGALVAYLDPESLFLGYFRCLSRCRSGGFPLHFGEIMGADPGEIPGYDPEAQPCARETPFPPRNLNLEVKKYVSLMGKEQYAYFHENGASRATVEEMRIGYNGRYLVYPYILEDGNCYAARCILPGREDDRFWHGNPDFFTEQYRIFNGQEIERCRGGALFLTEGENNLLAIKELGFPGIAVPSFADIEFMDAERLESISHLLIWMNHSPEASLSARNLATRIGFKARIIQWPPQGAQRGCSPSLLSVQKGKEFRATVAALIKTSRSYSPFNTVEKEHRHFQKALESKKGRELAGLSTGFKRMDAALDGIRGINIMGGQPKAGKSCFFMQVSTEMAGRKIPVIYYDFENGREKIYTRTLCRLSRVAERDLRGNSIDQETAKRVERADSEFRELLPFFKVVTDRKLSPEIMRRHIDFLQHETRKDSALVVVDSLHKLPFRNLSERRTGIDEWLRHMEAIRDEQNVSFLVISELSRGEGGSYDQDPGLGLFKESGDIEYSADNALILMPAAVPTDGSRPQTARKSTLWLVASRENNPGAVGDYLLDYPYWGFREL